MFLANKKETTRTAPIIDVLEQLDHWTVVTHTQRMLFVRFSSKF